MHAIVHGYNVESVRAAYLLYVQAMTEFTLAVQAQNRAVAMFWGNIAIDCQDALDRMLYREFVSAPIQHLSYYEFQA